MVEASKQTKIQTCEHVDDIAIFVGPPKNIALCNDCYFEQQDIYGKKGQTMKKAALQQITELESLEKIIAEQVRSCSQIQDSVINEESLESEIARKVNRQFDQLKTIIDEQKVETHNTVKYLESVQEYKPPPQDIAKETLAMLTGVKDSIQAIIAKHKAMSTSSSFFNILQE